MPVLKYKDPVSGLWVPLAFSSPAPSDPMPFRSAAGQVVVALSAAASGFTAVTLPTDRFTVVPLVLISMISAPGGTAKFVPRVVNPTITGFSAYVYTGDQTSQTGSVTLAWFAVQMLPGAAAG